MKKKFSHSTNSQLFLYHSSRWRRWQGACWWFHRVAHVLWAAARRSLLVCANHGRDYHATWPAPATSHISHAFCHDFSWYKII